LEFTADASGTQRFCTQCGQSLQIPIIEHTEHESRPEENLFEKGTKQAQHIIRDLQEIPFKKEVLPFDADNIHILTKDFIFWSVTLLGIIPLLIVTIEKPSLQLTMFALFFAFFWGVIFKKFIIQDSGTQGLAIGAMFFTGIAGIWLLLHIYQYLPDFYIYSADSKNLFVSLLGYIFQVGICEELLKSIPVFIALKWFRKDLNSLSLITIGVFSGLGFAAFENLHYGDTAIGSAYQNTIDFGVSGLVSGVQNAMVLILLRSLSLVFCHAVFSGILAYFITIANHRNKQKVALIIVGLFTAAVLHGAYDWLAGLQPTLAAFLAGFSFILFYGYLMKLKVADKKEIQALSVTNDADSKE
jgi:RsiW-degrading membrane proteinase PrsW (M82 family)